MCALCFSAQVVVDTLACVCGVISSRNSVPILETVKVERIGSGGVRLTASDGDMWLSMSTNVELCDDGIEFCVDGIDFMRTLRNLGDIRVKLSLDVESSTLTCEYDGGKFTLPYFSVDEFPKPMEIGDDFVSYNLSMSNLCNSVNTVRFCVADELLRPTLNGVYCRFGEFGLTTVATDGNRLAVFRDDSVRFDKESNVILAKKFVNVLLSLNNGEISTVTMNFTDRIVELKCDGFTFVARVVEGRYPNYEMVIPQNSDKRVVVERQKLLSSLKRVTPLGDTNSQLVSLDFGNDVIVVDARNIDFNKSATERVAITSAETSDNIKIGFKGNSLIDVLSAIQSENVTIEMTDESHAAVFYGHESMRRTEFLSILMPMLLQ